MKQWEQIAFTIALAAFGWLLYNQNYSIKKSATNTAQWGGQKAPLFMSLNQIDIGSYLTPNVANDVPVDQGIAGQAFANGYEIDDNYVPGS